MQRVNYDKIAHLYDEPSRDHIVDSNLIECLEGHPEFEKTEIRVLDIGCGTGKQLSANRKRFPKIEMIGLDLFSGMLREAKKRERSICWIQGNGACLPLETESIHYAVNQFSYPHIQNKGMFLREVYRVLKPHGQFVVWNIDPWSMPNWILYHYFPQARNLDFADFLPAAEFTHQLKQIGFENVRSEHVHRETREDLRTFHDYVQQRHRTSQLMALADKDYLAGLEHINRDLLEKNEMELFVNSDVSLVTIKSIKP